MQIVSLGVKDTVHNHTSTPLWVFCLFCFELVRVKWTWLSLTQLVTYEACVMIYAMSIPLFVCLLLFSVLSLTSELTSLLLTGTRICETVDCLLLFILLFLSFFLSFFFSFDYNLSTESDKFNHSRTARARYSRPLNSSWKLSLLLDSGLIMVFAVQKHLRCVSIEHPIIVFAVQQHLPSRP